MKHFSKWLIGVAVAGSVFAVLPPFHVVKLRDVKTATVFDASKFAGEFWRKHLLPATQKAVSAVELSAALAKDPAGARKQFGRSLGLSASTEFLVQGSGRVVSIEKESVRVALDGAPQDAVVELVTGLLFGNTVRDATGLIDVNLFPNSQEFNDISTGLNHIVETEVAPALRERAAVGKAIRFAGCVELEEGDPPKELPIIPVKVEWP